MAIKFEKKFTDKIKAIIPIYGGYFKRENRKKTDQLVREKTLLFIKHAKDAIDQLTTTLVQKGEKQAIASTEKLRGKIDVVLNTIRTTEYGYSAIFDLKKPDIKKLEKVVEYDARVIIKSKNFQKHTEELCDKAVDTPDVVLKDSLDLLREIEVLKKDWERRRDIIAGVEDIEEEVEYP